MRHNLYRVLEGDARVRVRFRLCRFLNIAAKIAGRSLRSWCGVLPKPANSTARHAGTPICIRNTPRSPPNRAERKRFSLPAAAGGACATADCAVVACAG